MSFLWNESEPFIDQDISTRSVFDNLGSTKTDVWRAVGREALLDNPEMLLWNIGQIEYEKQFNQEKITQEEFDEHYGESGLEYDPNMTKELVTYLLERKKQREINEYIISKGEGGLIEAAGSFGAAVLSSFASPTNIALSFVPIGGQARWVQFANKYGKLKGVAAKGATAGAVFQAGFEPVIAYSRGLEQRPYTLEDSIENIGVSATFSGMVNVAGYGAGKLKGKLEELYIARKQLDAGMHIDLDVPHEAQSIYETGRNPELLEIAETLETEKQKSPIQSAEEFIAKHRSKKIGFKEYLRQTELRGQTISKELLCGLMNDLEKASLGKTSLGKSDLVYAFKSKYLGSSPYQADIARELANLSTKEHVVGYTGSKVAAKIAQIVHKWQGIALMRANRAGAHITPLDGYITRQMHSSRAIRNMGYAGWRDFILPLLDLDKTPLASATTLDGINLQEIYNSLATGIHSGNGISDHSGYNLSKSVSAQRKLHFKSADHWMQYNEECGQYKNLSDAILVNLQSLAKSIAMLDMLGDNPQSNFMALKNTVIDSLKEKAASGNKYALSDIQYLRGNKLDNIFNFMHGMDMAGSPFWAAVGQWTRGLKTMASLGSVVTASFPDIASWAGELSNQGKPILQSYRHVISDLLKGMSSKEGKEFARNLGIASESMFGFAYNRLQVDSPSLGALSKMTGIFFKLNCMDWWDSSFKSTLGLILSRNLASKVNTPFKELPQLLQQQLSRYSIDETNWHLYKNFKKRINGNYYLIPDSSLMATAKDNIANTTRASNQARIADDLGNNLRRYLLDRVDTSISTPHAAENALALWGTKGGTGVGEFARFFMQFKTFPIAYVMRPLNAATLERIPTIKRTGIFTEDLKQSLATPGTIAAMTQLLIGSTVFGYLSMCSGSLLRLQDMPDPEDSKVWTAAVIKGGGLGIFGDFIFNEYDRYGRTFMAEAQGAVISDINSIASIIAKAKEGKMTKAREEALKLRTNNIPGRNLFYLLPAITLLEK